MSDDTVNENQLDQFGLGPEDAAHDDAGKPRKGESDADTDADSSSVNTFGMGPEDKEQHRS